MVNSTKCSKVEQVNAVISDKGISSSWRVRTDKEAVDFVIDVLETEDVLGDESWQEALVAFTRHVVAYTSFMDELADEQIRYYGDCE